MNDQQAGIKQGGHPSHVWQRPYSLMGITRCVRCGIDATMVYASRKCPATTDSSDNPSDLSDLRRVLKAYYAGAIDEDEFKNQVVAFILQLEPSKLHGIIEFLTGELRSP